MPLVRYRSDDRIIVPEHYGTQDLEDVCLGLKPLISFEGRDREYVIAPDGRVIIGLNTVTHGIAGLLRMQGCRSPAADASCGWWWTRGLASMKTG